MELWESLNFGTLARWSLQTMQGSPRFACLEPAGAGAEGARGIVTVHQFEAGLSQPRRATLDVIRRAFEAAGVEFINENGGGAGVRLRQRTQKTG